MKSLAIIFAALSLVFLGGCVSTTPDGQTKVTFDHNKTNQAITDTTETVQSTTEAVQSVNDLAHALHGF